MEDLSTAYGVLHGFAEALRVWRRDPDAATPVVAAGAAPVPAPTPPAGEPTVYVPPRVTRPADRVPVGPPPRRLPPPERDRDEGQPWWIWLLALLAVVILGPSASWRPSY